MNAADLQKFCSVDSDIRDYLRQPWTRDGYTFASNGHIAVRVPALEGVPDNSAVPDMMKTFAAQEPPKAWLPVPVIDGSFAPVQAKCDLCYGSGEHECADCGTEHECGECDGTGYVMEQPSHKAVPVGDSHFADYYLSLIQGWEIAPNGGNAAWIRCVDADGLLMPRRP